ncbi:MAG: peroxidase family protein [Mycobacterium sp.]|uniref:peroxidase family protein n=1 Tax=Mycobacterium sp. TaxID=1785 RepID=UPI003C580DD8
MTVPSKGQPHALAGLDHFKNERYDAAAQEYDAAIQAGGSDSERLEWQEMRDLAKANATAQIWVDVPKVEYFELKKLLDPPPVKDGDLPRPEPRRPRRCCFKRLRLYLGEALGAVMTVGMNWLIEQVGRRFGHPAKVWTNWDRRCWGIGVLILAYMREQLNAHNLISTYPRGKLVGFQKPNQPRPVGVTDFRTADGSWNNLADPKEGAAGTRFLSNVELSAIRPEINPKLLHPDPREISRRLLTRPNGDDGRPHMEPVVFLNLLAASWIQFMTHDWVSHGEVAPKAFIQVPLQTGDPAIARYQQNELRISATQEDPTRDTDGPEPAARSSINEVTHWWDGSQIYGSDQDTQGRLRNGKFGKMKATPRGKLPIDWSTRVEDAGFRRNWWVGLTMLHTLFVREHNAICDMLHEAYPAWDDNRLFNVARLINAALMAKIHSVEWTPAILPNQTLEVGLNSNWYGLLTYLRPNRKDRKTLAEVNIRNPELGGIVGNPINRHDCAYGLTEEFVEVYRLHSLLPETLQLRRRGKQGIDEVPLAATRQHGSIRLTSTYAMSDLFYSFGNQHPGALVLNNYPRFMQQLSVAGNPFLDMGTVDIVRARERGVPRYNEFRRQLGLNEIRSFDDLTDCTHLREELKSVYGDVEDLDLLIGTLAEGHRPYGFGFGETVFQIFIVSASRRLQADRFFTDDYNEEVYTAEGLEWIDRTDLKTVLLRHYPELADTGLANIKNAFEPWDEGPNLDPYRHPLREWDSELKDDPWRGDAYPRA